MYTELGFHMTVQYHRTFPNLHKLKNMSGLFDTFKENLCTQKSYPHLSPLSLSLLPKSLPQAAHQRDLLHLSLLSPLLLLPYTNHIQEPHNLLPLALGSLHHSWYITETFGSSFDTKEKPHTSLVYLRILAADPYSCDSATVYIQSYKFLNPIKFLLLLMTWYIREERQ